MADEIVAYSKTTGMPFDAAGAKYLESIGKGSLLRWVSTPTRVSQDINLALAEARKTDPNSSITQDKFGNYIIRTYDSSVAESLAKQGVLTNFIKETTEEQPEKTIITTETTTYQPTISRFPSASEKEVIVEPVVEKVSDLKRLEDLRTSLGIGAGLRERGVITIADTPQYKQTMQAGYDISKSLVSSYETNVLKKVEKHVDELVTRSEAKAPKSFEESTPVEVLKTGVDKLALAAETGLAGVAASVLYLPKAPEMATGVLATSFMAGQQIGRGELGGAYETIAAPIGMVVADVSKKPAFYTGMAIGGILTGEALKGVVQKRATAKIAERTTADVLVDVTHRGKTTVTEQPIISIIKQGKEFKVADTKPYDFAGGKVITRIEAEVPRLLKPPEKIVGIGAGKVQISYRQKPVSISEVVDVTDILNPRVVKRLAPPVAGAETTLTASAGKGYSTITGILQKTKKGLFAGEKVVREPLFIEEAGTKIVALSETAKDLTLTKALAVSKKGLKTDIELLTKSTKGGYLTLGGAETNLGAKIRILEIEPKGIPKYEITPIKRTPYISPYDQILKGEKPPITSIKVTDTLRSLQKSYRDTAIKEAEVLKEVSRLTGGEVTKQVLKPIEDVSLKSVVQSIAQKSVSDFITKEAKAVAGEAGTTATMTMAVTSALPKNLRPPGQVFADGEVLIDYKTKFRVPEPQLGFLKDMTVSEKVLLAQIQEGVVETVDGELEIVQTQTGVQTLVEEQILETITDVVTEEVTEEVVIPPTLPSFVFPPYLPKVSIPVGVKGYPEKYYKRTGGRRTITTSKYKPSLAGLFYNVKARARPGVVTGVEIRPYIVSGALLKKRRVKRRKSRRKR